MHAAEARSGVRGHGSVREMRIIPVFREERPCASAHPARPVPMIAIVRCFSFELEETVVVEYEAELGEDGGELVVCERSMVILNNVVACKKGFGGWRRVKCKGGEKKESLPREARKAEPSRN